MKLAIITGGSKGLGRALVNVYSEAGWQVKEFSRTGSGEHHISADLSSTSSVISITDDLFSTLSLHHYDEILLVNNAGTLTPIRKIASIQNEELLNSLSVNLLSSVAVINSFIRHFRNVDAQKTVVNISSGAVLKGYPGWSLYCAAKAGCENFINSIAEEEQNETHPFTVLNFDPDVMDTDMQAEIRNAEAEHFPPKQRFLDYHNSGNLRAPIEVAKKLYSLLSDRHGLKQTRYAVKDL